MRIIIGWTANTCVLCSSDNRGGMKNKKRRDKEIRKQTSGYPISGGIPALQQNPGIFTSTWISLGCFLISLSCSFIPPRLSDEHSTAYQHSLTLGLVHATVAKIMQDGRYAFKNLATRMNVRQSACRGGLGFFLYMRCVVTTPSASSQCVRRRNHEASAAHWLQTVTHCGRAKNKIAGRLIPFLVLGFWDKHTGICAGAMPYRRDLRPLPGSRRFKQKKARFCLRTYS